MLLKEFNNVEGLFNSFIKSGKIRVEKLDEMDKFHDICLEEQRMIITDSMLSIEFQSCIFSTLKNVRETSAVMKDALMSAHARGENPTTVELCVQISPFINEILSVYSDLKGKFSEDKLNKMKLLSFDLLRFARKIGFSRDYEKEMIENKMSDKRKIEFIDGFRDNLKTTIYHEYENID